MRVSVFIDYHYECFYPALPRQANDISYIGRISSLGIRIMLGVYTAIELNR